MQHPYLPHTPEERQRIYSVLGIENEEELLSPIPSSILLKSLPQLPPGLSEVELAKKLRGLAEQNADLIHHPCFLGAGAYFHHIPAVVDHLSNRSEFYTSYTPYQPEMSQGMLQAIFEFQTMIAELCGLPIANASLYDGASATAEAALMALDASKRRKIMVPQTIHPHYREVLRTYLRFRDVELIELPLGNGFLTPDDLSVDNETAALIVGYPNFFGLIEDLEPLAEVVHKTGAYLVTIANPIALGLLESPGNLGADLVIGEGQPLGNPPSFGGPSLGFLACSNEFVRRVPGRLVGETVDHEGRRGFVLTLQTREQHIRREKATSNICSNAALLALRASIYLATVGPAGLRQVATQSTAAAHMARDLITAGGKYKIIFSGPFFHEFVVSSPVAPSELNRILWDEGIIGGLDLSSYYPQLGQAVLLALTEIRTVEEIEKLARIMEAIAR